MHTSAAQLGMMVTERGLGREMIVSTSARSVQQDSVSKIKSVCNTTVILQFGEGEAGGGKTKCLPRTSPSPGKQTVG